MARIVKEHDIRRSEILDAAQQLFYQKGYEQTSVQNILEAIGIAKGTFYHYFDSKQALLEELVERIARETLRLVEPIVTNEQLTAVEKLEQFFLQIAQWKAERKPLLLQVLRAFYLDENILLRYTLLVSTSVQVVPLLATIIEQGMAEGSFAPTHSVETAGILLKILQSFAESMARLILDPPPHALALTERRVMAHQQAIERILGAPNNSLRLFELDIVKQWLP